MSEPLTILLVDDSPYDRGIVRRELKQEFGSVEIIEATNESEFAAALDLPTFDLVITDYQIRWIDGLKVLQAVREKRPHCPVLMFTATGNEEVAVEAMKSGLDDYIIKNVQHLVRLRAAVRSALEHARTRLHVQQLETRLATLLDHLRVGVFLRRLDGTVVEANDAAAAIFGLAKGDDLIGRKISDLLVEPILPTDQTPCLGEPAGDLEVPALLPDGRMVHVTINERAVSAHDGSSLVEGLLDDVTERRNAEEQVRQLKDEMAHVDRLNTMTEMAAGIAHELNQPLSAIANYSSVCESRLRQFDDDASRELADMLALIKEMSHQSGDIIRGLRGFAQRNSATHAPIQICDLIDSVLTMLVFELRSNAVTVEWNRPDDLPVVTVDRIQIRQVLVNLITNGIQAMAATFRNSRVLTIRVQAGTDALSISISDQGTGVEDGEWDRLFEPFVSTRPDGTGIGLSISRRIIEAHGGTLAARNNQTSGATLEFTLPLDARVIK